MEEAEAGRGNGDVFRIVLIIALVAFILCLIVGGFCACKKTINIKWGMWNEKKRRKPVSKDID